MFGLGLTEIIVIVLVILVLINPKDLPKIARKLGQWYRKAKNVHEDVNKEIRDVENAIRRPFEESSKEMEQDAKELGDSINSVGVSQPLPDLKTIMPSRSPVLFKESYQQENEDGEEDEQENIDMDA